MYAYIIYAYATKYTKEMSEFIPGNHLQPSRGGQPSEFAEQIPQSTPL